MPLTTHVHFSTLRSGLRVIGGYIDEAQALSPHIADAAASMLRQAATDCEALQRQLLLKAAELEASK